MSYHKETANLKKKISFWSSARMITMVSAVSSLPLVPLLYGLAKANNSPNYWIHPLLVSIIILLAIWSWIRLKYYQEKALSLGLKIEGRNGL